MEIFRTEDFFIFIKDNLSLWWDRHTGSFIPKTDWDLTDADDPICLGICYGIIGLVEHPSVFDSRLLLIKEAVSVGNLHGNNEVFKIKSVVFLKMDGECDGQLQECPKHKSMLFHKNRRDGPLFDLQPRVSLSKTLGTLKSAGNVIKTTTQQAAAMATGAPVRRDKDRFEKSLVEEFHRIFTDTSSFYYSYTCDITSSLQRLCHLEKKQATKKKALWKTVNDKFFWNKHMLKHLIESNNPLCDPWILPIIQGYIQIEDCKVNIDDLRDTKSSPKYEVFKLCILSRRSRFRAGTRYKRRGVDENGSVPITLKRSKLFSTTITKSPSFKFAAQYLFIGRNLGDDLIGILGETETKLAFNKHFTNEIRTYGPVCIINLIDQSGKEKVVWDAYSHHIFQYNSPYITYVTFDFHEYCRGMHFENVSLLISSIAEIIKEMNYCWRDRQGHICSQAGVFRTNCIDCLDRTNVVQTALGKAVMEIQFCNTVELEAFSEPKAGPYDEDTGATAERVKWLIEDCKKMLINNPEMVLGSWGLINADPSTGDPHETEMDTILILTRDSYFVADYDDQVDKVTKYQKVPLSDITLLESESLKSICEAFIVGLDIAGIHSIKYNQGHKLDKRKSKVITDGRGTNMYLDIVGLPQLTRNVSETQLLALKNAGNSPFPLF
ncbi:phosphatidylinositide phosphatase sac1 [Holotrichia oblita]|uniref:Phosphatidylinositide phosphatase sac1 n=1 Tax=Holotrichia oblita TaxID=644536 RepID=A0ACB9T6C8_HOLOL|nr:phosphatidylinositide phosphatase sac1 [Holotrichia oblita]